MAFAEANNFLFISSISATYSIWS